MRTYDRQVGHEIVSGERLAPATGAQTSQVVACGYKTRRGCGEMTLERPAF
jgi:hypothetical protein